MNLHSNAASFLSWIENPEVRQLIKKFSDRDSAETALTLSSYPKGIRIFIADQVLGRQKARLRFPFLLDTDGIVFPSNEDLQQSSSEITAKYKTSQYSGHSFTDLTAGFGIDAYFFSKSFSEFDVVERSEYLRQLIEYNYNLLNIYNLNTIATDITTYLKGIGKKRDLAYLDPSRRSRGKRTQIITEYSPNPVDLIPNLERAFERILIKLSPGNDISQILGLIPNTSCITVISAENECREILVEVSRQPFDGTIRTVDLPLHNTPVNYEFDLNLERRIHSEPSAVLKYLYLPNAAVMKAGAFNSLSESFEVKKISDNTHLYTDNSVKRNFPGRIFECLETFPYRPSAFREKHNGGVFKVLTRNFPDSIEAITKKLKIGNYGQQYLFAYRNFRGHPELAVCDLMRK